jgi:hypothetical protein
MRSRIVISDSFETQPPGIDGSAVLVRADPGLQNSLVDLLEANHRKAMDAIAAEMLG